MRALDLLLPAALSLLAVRGAVAYSPRPRLVQQPRCTVGQVPLPGLIRGAFESAQLDPPPAVMVAAWPLLAALCGVVLSVRVGVAVGAGVAATVAVGPVVTLMLLRGRRARSVDKELPVLLEAVSRSLRSGVTPREAIGESLGTVTGPLRQDVEALVARLALGAPLDVGLRRWQESAASPAVGLAVAALSLGGMAGGARAHAVDNVAATLRETLALQSEVGSLTTQARASAVVMALLPVGFLALTAAADSNSTDFLFATPIGLTCLALGLVLEAAGAAWMMRLTRSVR